MRVTFTIDLILDLYFLLLMYLPGISAASKDMEMVENRLSQLATLLPDMADKLERMRVDILLSLLQNMEVRNVG
jgi:hypothetical protein